MQVAVWRREGVEPFASIFLCCRIASYVRRKFRCGFVFQGRTDPDLILSRHDQQACTVGIDDANHLDVRVVMYNYGRWEKEQISRPAGVLET